MLEVRSIATAGVVTAASRPERTSVGELLELMYVRPAWQADALCVEHPEINWFPTLGDNAVGAVAAARAICSTCLVRTECLTFALEHDVDGTWAGTTYRQRRRGLAAA